MNHLFLPSFDGTAALSPVELVEEEFAKDRWDAHHIPGLRYAPHTNNCFVRFTGVPERFRLLVKEYAKCWLAADPAVATLDEHVYYLGRFFTVFVEWYPDANTLHALSEHDVDRFLRLLKATPNRRGKPISDRQIEGLLRALKGFLRYLERIQSPVRPQAPLDRIIWPHHHRKLHFHANPDRIKYIPQVVLQQLDAHLPHLTPTYIPLVILLRASGWRISDVLSLKIASCLEQEGDHYWLVGDIQKTRVLQHRIPITSEVAAVVSAQIKHIQERYAPQENPKGWLFPASKRAVHGFSNNKRFAHGDPLQSGAINKALNALARTYHIVDEHGTLFHFRSHAFRHTKAVELINNGMSLIQVQQWMAHASPEMTLIYAKILDDTMRKAWEKTVQLGVVQFKDGKPAFLPGTKLLPMAGSNTFDPERVREHRHNVKMALGSCLKTAKIVCKFVELPCFHCPAYVLTPNDLPALEIYEKQILERIEIGKQAGNAHWIEVNQKNLDERVRPAMALLQQGHILAKTEKQEREYTDEEWDQR